jgi:hypothetical protein
MAEYSQVFIDYCREMMPMDSFRIFMDFLDAEDVDVNCSLLKGGSVAEYPPAGKLKRGQPAKKINKKG